jgi:hypothetical protein
MQEWHLAISRCPELENSATRSGPNSTISRCFGRDGKCWQRRKSFRIWSGLSESNRHLNLGKVPYYHYTKAAQPHSFYSMTARKQQAQPNPLTAAQSQTFKSHEVSGDLGNPGGLYHRRATLALREARGLILVRVDAAEFFSVGIIDTDEVMVMFAAAIFAEGTLASIGTFCRHTFCHVSHLSEPV